MTIPPRIEQVLRLFVVTPDLHRVHHSSIEEETNSNFGVVFSWWDRLMRTYCAEPSGGQRNFKIGLEKFQGGGELWLLSLLSQPFRQRRSMKPANEGDGLTGLHKRLSTLLVGGELDLPDAISINTANGCRHFEE